MSHWEETAEIADPVMVLCSDAARYVTGTILPLDGGYVKIFIAWGNPYNPRAPRCKTSSDSQRSVARRASGAQANQGWR